MASGSGGRRQPFCISDPNSISSVFTRTVTKTGTRSMISAAPCAMPTSPHQRPAVLLHLRAHCRRLRRRHSPALGGSRKGTAPLDTYAHAWPAAAERARDSAAPIMFVSLDEPTWELAGVSVAGDCATPGTRIHLKCHRLNARWGITSPRLTARIAIDTSGALLDCM